MLQQAPVKYSIAGLLFQSCVVTLFTWLFYSLSLDGLATYSNQSRV